MIAPLKKDFLELVKNGKPPPLHEEISYLHPHLIYESLASPNSFLLESMKGPMKIARYSFIGFDPYTVFRVKNGLIEIEFPGNTTAVSCKPLNILKELVSSYKQVPSEYLPPFQGGAVGILSYDFVRYLEKLPNLAVGDLNLPDAHFLMVDKLVAFDHQEQKFWVIVCPGARDTGKNQMDWSKEYDEEEYRIQKEKRTIEQRAKSSKASLKPQSPWSVHKVEINYEMRKNNYMDIVRRAKEYIAAGDIFQANLSQRVSSHIGTIDRWSIYSTLSAINPAPFAAFLDFGDYQIVSSSPERLLRVNDGIVETRPIAGTRPRGRDWREDEFMRAELLLNEKERAEHIMLVAIERNDLGRVSDYGTVRVDELMITEDCSHVIHIVSNVRGI